MKNITEQISIIETNREISAAILQNYLPAQNTQRLPALMGTRESKGFESEREILYSVLFDMRQEVAELKKMVHNLMAERAGQVGQVGQMGTVVTTPVVTAHQLRYLLSFTPCSLRFARMTMTYKTRKNM